MGVVGVRVSVRVWVVGCEGVGVGGVGVVECERMDKDDVVCAVFHDSFSKELAVKCILDKIMDERLCS